MAMPSCEPSFCTGANHNVFNVTFEAMAEHLKNFLKKVDVLSEEEGVRLRRQQVGNKSLGRQDSFGKVAHATASTSLLSDAAVSPDLPPIGAKKERSRGRSRQRESRSLQNLGTDSPPTTLAISSSASIPSLSTPSGRSTMSTELLDSKTGSSGPTSPAQKPANVWSVLSSSSGSNSVPHGIHTMPLPRSQPTTPRRAMSQLHMDADSDDDDGGDGRRTPPVAPVTPRTAALKSALTPRRTTVLGFARATKRSKSPKVTFSLPPPSSATSAFL